MYQNDSSYRCLISIKYCIITERGENILDLQKHKEYLWKYLLTYGKARKKREDYRQLVFPFQDIVIEEGKTVEDYRREALKQQLEACSSIEEIFDMISLEYKDYYFMEISSLLHDDQTLYSHLLKKTMDTAGITDYISAHNYEYLIKFADEETQQYITQKLTQ